MEALSIYQIPLKLLTQGELSFSIRSISVQGLHDPAVFILLAARTERRSMGGVTVEQEIRMVVSDLDPRLKNCTGSKGFLNIFH